MKRIVLLFATALPLACAPTSRAPEGTCDATEFSAIEGLDIETVTLPAELEQRVIGPGMAVTMDFRPNRLNVEIDDAGMIRRVYCG
jgi:hypothetical protein